MVRPPVSRTWALPPSGYSKLNCDASYSKERNCSGIGFLLRDHLGHCQLAVFDPIHFAEVVVGEAEAIRQGVLEVISEGAMRIKVESDNQEVVTGLQYSERDSTLSIRPIIKDILYLASYFVDCQFQFTSRATNVVADTLARRA
ncbi:uncharacterized protein LOC122668666 [Telopea speciosissima]|uniref:uncharacterized protein LOC122668666 n=1 Tax=Telopea speciosissima TaxID=54955 RepID=UPI001CC8252B|nr:uncharacterized protein LOC122668666 [Telopea speciosissima]